MSEKAERPINSDEQRLMMSPRRSHPNQGVAVEVTHDHYEVFVPFAQRNFIDAQTAESRHLDTDFFALTDSTIDQTISSLKPC